MVLTVCEGIRITAIVNATPNCKLWGCLCECCEISLASTETPTAAATKAPATPFAEKHSTRFTSACPCAKICDLSFSQPNFRIVGLPPPCGCVCMPAASSSSVFSGFLFCFFCFFSFFHFWTRGLGLFRVCPDSFSSAL